MFGNVHLNTQAQEVVSFAPHLASPPHERILRLQRETETQVRRIRYKVGTPWIAKLIYNPNNYMVVENLCS